jgi:hypothetical protein
MIGVLLRGVGVFIERREGGRRVLLRDMLRSGIGCSLDGKVGDGGWNI